MENEVIIDDRTERLLTQLSICTIYQLGPIEEVYKIVNSIDTTIRVLDNAARFNMCPVQVAKILKNFRQ